MTAARSVRSLVLQWGFRAAVPVLRSLDHRVNGDRNFSACRQYAYPVPRHWPQLRIYTIRSLEKSTPSGGGGVLSFMPSSASTTRSAMTRFRYHFRFAGTIYQGARSVLVADMTSSKALMYFLQSFLSSRSPEFHFQRFSGS